MDIKKGKFVPPKNLIEKTVDAEVYVGSKIVSGVANLAKESTSVTNGLSSGGEVWTNFSINLNPIASSKKAVNLLNDLMETLNKAASVLQALLKVVEIFVSDFSSLTSVIKGLVKKVLDEIKKFLGDFENTGLYILCVPTNFNDQNTLNFPIGGGVDSFKQKVTAALYNTKDPNHPGFSEDAYVGGLVIMAAADANDPNGLNELMQNLSMLSNFFPGLVNTAQPASPVGVKALPGLYSLPFSINPLTNLKNQVGLKKQIGIKITWEDNPSTSFINLKSGTTHYYVFRSTTRQGTPLGEDGKPVTSISAKTKYKQLNGGIVRVYANEGTTEKDVFNKGLAKVVVNSPFETFNEIIDFDVLPDVEYFYIVVPAFGDLKETDYLNFLDVFKGAFGIPSKVVSAKATACIPDYLQNWIEYPDGRILPTGNSNAPHWESLNVKTILGPQSDRILSSLVQMLNIAGSYLETANSNFSSFQKNFKRKIQAYLRVISRINKLLSLLSTYKIVGSVSLLNLREQKGGIAKFAQRVNAAKLPDKLKKINPISGISTGVVLLYGYSGSGSSNVRRVSQYDDYGLLADPFSDSKDSAEALAAMEPNKKIISIISQIFGGSK